MSSPQEPTEQMQPSDNHQVGDDTITMNDQPVVPSDAVTADDPVDKADGNQTDNPTDQGEKEKDTNVVINPESDNLETSEKQEEETEEVLEPMVDTSRLEEEVEEEQEEGEEEEEEEEEDEEEEEEEGSSRKRQRRSTSSFTPADFKHEPHKPIEIPPGRGVKLGEIGPIQQNVNKKQSTDPILLSLHKFLLGGPGGCLGKGRTSKNLVKKHILDFSGYLPPLKEKELKGEGDQGKEGVEKGEEVQEKKEEEGLEIEKKEAGDVEGLVGTVEKEETGAVEGQVGTGEKKGEGEEEPKEDEEDEEMEEMDEEEEEAEERMISKAEKLSLPLLKSFCDILCLDRRPIQGKVPNKNMLIDRLLDFLAEPTPDGIDVEASSPKKRGRKPKNHQKEESAMDVDEEEVSSPKKKRGRPRKQKEESAEDEEKVKIPKKRGRPRKQKEESPSTSAKEDDGEEESGEDEDDEHMGADGEKKGTLMEKDLRKFARSYAFLFLEEKATLEHAMELATEKFGDKLDDGKKEMLTTLLNKAMGKPKKK